MRTIKHIRQDLADDARAQAALRKEGRELLAIATDKRTTEQQARLTACEQELDALVATAATLEAEHAQALKFQDEERQQGRSASRIEMGHDHAEDRAWGPRLPDNADAATRAEVRRAALGEFGIAIYNAATGRGQDPRLYAAATGMNTVNPADGGFAVPQEHAVGIEREMYTQGELLSRVDARTVTGDSITYTVIDETSRVAGSRQGGVRGYWVDQGTAPDTSQTKLARIELKLRKVGAIGYMTDELVADAAALGGELEALFSEELIFQVEDAIFEGTGAGQPLGFSKANSKIEIAKETNQAASTIVSANLSKIWARLSTRSKRNAVWLINTDCNPQLDELSIPAGTAALEPRFVTYGPDGLLRIKGRPVIEVEYASTLGTVWDIALVDLSRYRLIRKGGVEQASSIHVRFTQGEQTFRAFYRVDGQPVPRSAVTPFKGTNTVSPFLTVATRA